MKAEELLNEHAGMLLVTAQRLAICEGEVDDLLQEGRLAVLKAWETFDAGRGASFKTYASRMAHNHMIDWIRRHRGLVRVPTSASVKGVRTYGVSLETPLRDEPNVKLWETLAAPEEELLPGNDVELLARVWAAVEKLPANERMVLTMRYRAAEPVTLEKLGEMMGMKGRSVYMMTHRAIKRLRGMLA